MQWTVGSIDKGIETEQVGIFFFLRIFPENEVETTWDFKNICVFLWKCYYMAYYGAMDLKV